MQLTRWTLVGGDGLPLTVRLPGGPKNVYTWDRRHDAVVFLSRWKERRVQLASIFGALDPSTFTVSRWEERFFSAVSAEGYAHNAGLGVGIAAFPAPRPEDN